MSGDDQLVPHDSEAKERETIGLFNVVDKLRKRAVQAERYLIAIAGPPGAGKSTFAADLWRQLEADGAIVVPMDGFHYDNAVLDQRGLRSRKGAPETFDYRGFSVLLQRIRDGERDIAFPLFDREADLARAGAGIVNQEKFIIVEGNYLLLNEKPWSSVADYFDFTIFIDVPQEELNERLLDRWRTHGFSQEYAENRVATNDMPNIERVLSAQKNSDLSLSCATSGEMQFHVGQGYPH
jgi:pantothenate kinase